MPAVEAPALVHRRKPLGSPPFLCPATLHDTALRTIVPVFTAMAARALERDRSSSHHTTPLATRFAMILSCLFISILTVAETSRP